MFRQHQVAENENPIDAKLSFTLRSMALPVEAKVVTADGGSVTVAAGSQFSLGRNAPTGAMPVRAHSLYVSLVFAFWVVILSYRLGFGARFMSCA